MLNDVLVAPSVLSADFAHLADELDSISSADFIHYDVMDGHFVPNLSFGLDILKAIKRTTDVPVDVHLMISNPDVMVPAYIEAGADMISFHLEAATHSDRLVQMIHSAGAKAAVAINPGTSAALLEELVGCVDMILVMSVNPGFGGQRFIPGTIDKLRRVQALCREHGADPLIEVDGGVSAENATEICAAGANVLVAGSGIFKFDDRAQAISDLRGAGELGLSKRA